MRTLDLATAVKEIRQGCERAKGRGEPPSFLFVVGAGISHPPVPLARDIIEHCKGEAQRWNLMEEPASTDPIDLYSHWFAQAYSQPVDRQRYLRDLIEKAFISRANFRLAHLLLEETVARTVVTPNFDDFLSRALILFGKPHIVCDHPQTVERINMESTDLQIIHVHGRYWFYDCANLRDEIASASRPSAQDAFTMASLLDDVFRSRAPLVIGYSGWEGDVIMGALKRRLTKPLPHNIYWFCYRSAEAQDMPAWLKDSANFCAVLPRQPAEASRDAAESRLSGGIGKEPVLEATAVLDALIREFGLQPPPLTRDPLGFFARQLRGALWSGETDEGTADVYAIRGLIERVEQAKGAEEQLRSKVNAELEAMREALRRSDYRSAVKEARRITLASLGAQQLRELADSMSAAGESLSDDSPEELSAYDLTVKASDLLTGQPEMVPAERVARALLNKGVTLGTLGRGEEAIAAYNEVVHRFAECREAAFREQVARALVSKGATLKTLGRSEEAIAAYEEVGRRFSESRVPALREQVAKALVNKGETLTILNRSEEAILAYHAVLDRFSGSPAPTLRKQVARAVLNMGDRLWEVKRGDEAITVYEDALPLFSASSNPAVRELAALVLVAKGYALGRLDRSEEAIAAYDEVLRRFSDSAEPALREQVAKALQYKQAISSPEAPGTIDLHVT
ncbi:MAG TPA: tetratricopeptide repeat protein [Terriglobia bacterium]|nr:tetratricopeptide repeat protein [Terriglobia bacterium]